MPKRIDCYYRSDLLPVISAAVTLRLRFEVMTHPRLEYHADEYTVTLLDVDEPAPEPAPEQAKDGLSLPF